MIGVIKARLIIAMLFCGTVHLCVFMFVITQTSKSLLKFTYS